MTIMPASAAGETGHATKAEFDAGTASIARLERVRNETGLRMGPGDTSRLVVPGPVLVAAPARDGVIASRDFVSYNFGMVRTGGLEPPRAYALRIFIPLRLSPPCFDTNDAECEFVVWTIPSP
jgi:hypothetical protein